ncbi:hypothetical protein AAX09_10415 (plasmid) [Moraxella bovoculi]|uniref:hypothetical protein n=1 Tax=Moraxella bovoculi TaxID=386891 RepID=UPI000624E96C|nr:hypothetical protein [Moraxella bovoculi]AKG19886.1 hypothetical protein AAX09_10415 [Moraxella bovoculi]
MNNAFSAKDLVIFYRRADLSKPIQIVANLNDLYSKPLTVNDQELVIEIEGAHQKNDFLPLMFTHCKGFVAYGAKYACFWQNDDTISNFLASLTGKDGRKYRKHILPILSQIKGFSVRFEMLNQSAF